MIEAKKAFVPKLLAVPGYRFGPNLCKGSLKEPLCYALLRRHVSVGVCLCVGVLCRGNAPVVAGYRVYLTIKLRSQVGHDVVLSISRAGPCTNSGIIETSCEGW